MRQARNYFVAAGMNSVGATAAGGVGRYLSELISDGKTSIDLWPVDIKRFVDLHNTKTFLRERVRETLGKPARCYSVKLALSRCITTC